MAGHCTFLPDFFHHQFGETTFLSPGADDVVFSVLEADHDHLEGISGGVNPVVSRKLDLSSPKRKRQKLSVVEADGGPNSDGRQKVSHMTVERNRRKQMNDHLSVLRSLMPRFYVKRGDQASIIGGVVDYITELQQILQTLEAKKQRKVYSEVLSPRLVSSPMTLSACPLSPRPSLPISPRTPQPATPYRSCLPTSNSYLSPSISTSLDHSSPANSFITNSEGGNDLMANLKSAIVEVEVKLVGGNLLLKTCSKRIPGQATKVIRVLENLSLEVLQANISIVDEAMVNSFTTKIGVECQLSAEELAQHIQSSFC
ncbi:transcription factor SPEECHLESS-like [Cynara cardunculus var. scolymus]|uniref:Myc-type, basic helix-loop-helix (BHLH) domain-containing protein n=1 Tax=Cynara cardunculus var. scolymus TaxID=59895 RepID=A0A103YDJ1_CYNCS|nr:transcription factor SPEECHLESS-like [Cynara cardunculus var. scolymus]KVI07102.1 Myc-type, basic helix-loop-helix (bHLH) domain-containing protein [Cynara cardunculus var. scolymus]